MGGKALVIAAVLLAYLSLNNAKSPFVKNELSNIVLVKDATNATMLYTLKYTCLLMSFVFCLPSKLKSLSIEISMHFRFGMEQGL